MLTAQSRAWPSGAPTDPRVCGQGHRCPGILGEQGQAAWAASLTHRSLHVSLRVWTPSPATVGVRQGSGRLGKEVRGKKVTRPDGWQEWDGEGHTEGSGGPIHYWAMG